MSIESKHFSHKERKREIHAGKPFATPEQLKLFATIWQRIAEEYSGKPQWSESDQQYRTESMEQLTDEIPPGETRLGYINNKSFFLMTPNKILEALESEEVDIRERRMRDNVSAGSDYRYSLGQEPGGQGARYPFWESLESIHHINFFDNIDQRLNRLREASAERPIRVLVLGGDVALFNDELRARYGRQVDVVGTTIETAYSRIRKRAIMQDLNDASKPRRLSDETRQYLLSVLNNDIHPNDRKWRSIVQMRDFPEFDMIIDSYGEITYSAPVSEGDDPTLFQLTMRAALAKLLPGGDLFVANMPYTFRRQGFSDYVPGHETEYEVTQRESIVDPKKDDMATAYTIHRAETAVIA